jgi:hypothetical protein
MNVFVLGTGRCGTLTFYNVCGHITNYTVGHEENHRKMNDYRLSYPKNHIEVDNRLSWYLGRLYKSYPDAYYVHLVRDSKKVAESFVRRITYGIMQGYCIGILGMRPDSGRFNLFDACMDYVETVTENIRMFLQCGVKGIEIRIENPYKEFRVFWEEVGADGNIKAAQKEFKTVYNKGPE